MEQTIKNILREANKENVDATVSINKANTLSINYEKDSLVNTADGDTDLMEIRVSKGKKFGYSITDNFNKWEVCFDKALKLMRVSKPMKKEILLSKPAKYKNVRGLYSKKVSEMPMSCGKRLWASVICSARYFLVDPNTLLRKDLSSSPKRCLKIFI